MGEYATGQPQLVEAADVHLVTAGEERAAALTTPQSTPDNKEKSPSAGATDSPVESAVSSAGWQADFNSLWRGSAASQVGAMCTAIATPLLVLNLTGSAKWAGFATAASILSGLVFYIPAGIVADRFDRRQAMLVSQSLRLGIMSALIFTVVFHQPRPEILVFAAFADGALATFYSTAEFASIPRIIPDGVPLPERVAKNESRNHIALLLGRPIGGTLYGLHHALPYTVDLLSACFSIITLRRISAEKFLSKAESQATPSRSQLRESVTWIKNDAYTTRVLATCFFSNFFFQIVFLILVTRAVHDNTSSAVIGLLTAATGLGGATGSFASPGALKRLNSFKILLISVGVWACLPAATYLLSDVEYSVAVWAGVSFMGANLNVALHVHLMTHAPRRRLGQVMSVNGFLLRGATASGALCAGYIISGGQANRALLASTAVMVLMLLILWFTRNGVSGLAAVIPAAQLGTPQPETVNQTTECGEEAAVGTVSKHGVPAVDNSSGSTDQTREAAVGAPRTSGSPPPESDDRVSTPRHRVGAEGRFPATAV